MASAPIKSSVDRRNLQSPTPDSPWSVDIVSAVPKKVVEEGALRQGGFMGRCSERWFCVGKETEDGKYVFNVWFSASTASLEEQKSKNPVLQLSHPRHLTTSSSNAAEDEDAPPMLISLQVFPQNAEIVYVYIANPSTGALLLWKLSRRDLSGFNMLAPPATAFTMLDDLVEGERLTELSVTWTATTPTILAASNTGRIWWITQTHVPITLNAQLADPSVSGILNRLWNSVQYHEHAPIAAVLVKDSTIVNSTSSGGSLFTSRVDPSTTFYSVTENGKLATWMVQRTEAQKTHFQVAPGIDLLEELRQNEVSAPLRISDLVVLSTEIHCTSIHIIVLLTHPNGEARLYWLCVNVDTSGTRSGNDNGMALTKTLWLNRFISPTNVRVIGMVAVATGIAYAAFAQDSSLPTVAMAMSPSTGDLYEVDLTQEVAPLLPGTMTKAVVTHGFCALDASGLGLSVRVLPTEPTGRSIAGQASSSPSVVTSLVNHLLSTFWSLYTHPDETVRLPPSLTNAGTADLEQAVVAVAQALQKKGDVSSRQNPLHLHLHLINILKEAGEYKRLSTLCRWKLLAVGQEVTVFWKLGSEITPQTVWEEGQLVNLQPHRVAEWLQNLQASVTIEGGGEDRHKIWLDWLCLAADTAATYREERSGSLYDVSPNKPPTVPANEPVPIWTSSIAMQTVWESQFRYWAKHVSAIDVASLESIAQYALLSYSDSHLSRPCVASRAQYLVAQRLVFKLLRKRKPLKEDDFCFELCVAHKYFNGICQISYDHEQRKDCGTFALEPLFQTLCHSADIETGCSFGIFVLKWHTDRKLFGHVLKYGKYCPENLGQLIRHVEELKPYKWIYNIRQGDYNEATTSLLQNAGGNTMNTPQVKLALSAASMTNAVVETESIAAMQEIAKKRRRVIDKTIELTNVQQELLGEEAKRTRLWTPQQLVSQALKKYDETEDRKEKASICLLALAACTGFDSPVLSIEAAARVWHRTIASDSRLWEKILAKESDLTQSRLLAMIRESSVFGILLEGTSSATSNWDDVVYCQDIENKVFGNFKGVDEIHLSGMKRLLRAVSADVESSHSSMGDDVTTPMDQA